MVFFLPVLSGPIGVDLHVCVLPGRSRSAGNGVQHVWAIRTGLCMRQSPAALVASGTSEMPSLATWPHGPGASADPIRLQHYQQLPQRAAAPFLRGPCTAACTRAGAMNKESMAVCGFFPTFRYCLPPSARVGDSAPQRM